jgi:transcriptional regulator with GAF, ATPase, and Fis domain
LHVADRAENFAMYSRNGHQDTPQSRLIAVETPTQLFITNIIRESSKPARQEEALHQSTQLYDNQARENVGALAGIVGQSKCMRDLFHLITLVAKSQATMLITD